MSNQEVDQKLIAKVRDLIQTKAPKQRNAYDVSLTHRYDFSVKTVSKNEFDFECKIVESRTMRV